jgi:site-specific DNA recombinase
MTKQTNSTNEFQSPKRAWLYLRVSSDGQVNTDYDPDGLSISAQREGGQDKAAQLEAIVDAEFSDPGKSAYVDLHKRTSFLEMLDALKEANLHDATRVDYVIVWSLSRWARNTVDHWQTRQLVRQTGARLISITEPMAGEDTASGFLYEGMVVTYNQYQSMLTGESVKRGLRKKAENGGTYGWARLGYVNAVDELPDGRKVACILPDPERSGFLTAAFELYASGEYSISKLAKDLHRFGLRTRRTRRHAGGKGIGTTTLHRILGDAYYAGWIVYKKGTPDEQTFQGRHQPLVDQETFDAVQALLAEKRVSGDRSQHRHHYLRGSVYCGECGNRLAFAMSTGRNGRRYPYFFCISRINGKPCSMRSNIRPQLIEDAIVRGYPQAAPTLTPKQVAARIAAIESLVNVSQSAVGKLKVSKTAQIAKLKAQQVRLLQLHMEEGNSVSPDAFREERARMQTEIAEAEMSLAEAERRLKLDATQLRQALEVAENVAPIYAEAPDKTRRGFNLAFFDRIEILPDKDPETGEPIVKIVGIKLTEPYEILASPELVPSIEAEVQAIQSPRQSKGDDPERSSPTDVSFFEVLAEGVGFEPTVPLPARWFSRPVP